MDGSLDKELTPSLTSPADAGEELRPSPMGCAVPDFVPVIGLAVVSGLALLTMVLVLIMTRPV